MKQVEVQILSQSYLLGCPEGGEQRLLEAVEKVNAAMCKIRDAGKVRARDRIAVLAALNLAFDQPAVAVPAPVAAPAPAAPAIAPVASAPAAAPAPGDDPRLTALLERLDAVLTDDGHLL